MTDITYYDIATGQIQGTFTGIDVQTYPNMPLHYVTGIYSGDDYYILGGVPVLKNVIPTPSNIYIRDNGIDTFTLLVPNPTLCAVSPDVNTNEIAVADSYSELITDGTFEVTGNVVGTYKLVAKPEAVDWARKTFYFYVTENPVIEGIFTKLNLTNPSINRQKLITASISTKCNLTNPVIDLVNSVSVPSLHTSSTLTNPHIDVISSNEIPSIITHYELTNPQIDRQNIKVIPSLNTSSDLTNPLVSILEIVSNTYEVGSLVTSSTLTNPQVNRQNMVAIPSMITTNNLTNPLITS